MVGNNSASVVADAFMKNVTKADAEKMYEGLLKGANSVHPRVSTTGRRGYEYYNKLGYVPYDVKINENAARTLEYAYDDWCIYRMGEKLGRPAEELELYKSRSQNYRNLFDPETKLMRGKNADGTFQTPFNPFKWGDAFTEGNSWHYTWSVFHDVQGLADLMGGRKMFVSMLDSVFNLPPIFDDSYYGGVIHEIREMEIANMGNYAHGADAADLLAVLDQCLDQVLEAEKDTLPDSLSEPGKKQVFTYGEGLKGMTWNETCAMWKKKYPVVQKKHWEQGEDKAANVYAAVQAISSRLKEGQITVVGNGSACVVGGHAQIIKKGQRFISNSAVASMGYDLPAAIGIWAASRKDGAYSMGAAREGEDVILITGDGSIQMNLQELQTIIHHKMGHRPLKYR